MAEAATKPGTACLCCRRRKLKCSREPSGCSSCERASLPCIYPTTDPAIKRKRGPYKKKDKPARQAHLDHVVKYLSDPVSAEEESRRHAICRSLGETPNAPQTPASEDLVKDALIALTRTTVNDTAPTNVSPHLDSFTTHQYLLAWHLFTIRVDPVTKLVFQNDVAPFFFLYMDGHIWKLGHSICYSAISSCTAEECNNIFGQCKVALQQHFRRRIQQDIIQDHATPDLESMQGLVLYLLCVCREELEAETWSLFSLVVRNAQLMNLHKDPTTTIPAEAEMRRRLWWTICSLESRCSEESVDRSTSLLSTTSVKLPLNINDEDLPLHATSLPKPRRGVTSMSFVLVRWHIMKTSAYIVSKLKHHKANPRLGDKPMQDQLGRELESVARLLHEEILVHCHESRPFDHLIMVVAEIMLIKCRLLIEFPQSTPDTLTQAERYTQLRLSVQVIRKTYGIISDQQAAIYVWFFRSYLQWHSLAVVITELGKSEDSAFVRSAWEALEPFVKMWSRIYQRKQHDLTWQHVNGLIKKAQQVAQSQRVNSQSGPSNCTDGALPFETIDWPTPFSQDDLTGPPISRDTQPYTHDDLDDLDGAMLDPLLNVPGLNAFGSDMDALNAVFADPNWEYGFDLMQDVTIPANHHAG